MGGYSHFWAEEGGGTPKIAVERKMEQGFDSGGFKLLLDFVEVRQINDFYPRLDDFEVNWDFQLRKLRNSLPKA